MRFSTCIIPFATICKPLGSAISTTWKISARMWEGNVLKVKFSSWPQTCPEPYTLQSFILANLIKEPTSGRPSVKLIVFHMENY